MSDQTDSQVANEDTNASQAAASQKQSGETQPGNSLAGAALVEAALKDPEAKEALRRQFQSEKDKSVADIKKQIEELQSQLNSPPNDGGQKAEEVQTKRVDVNIVKEAYALDWEDPENVRILAEHANDPANLHAKLGERLVARKQKPQPNAASVAAPAGSAEPLTSIESIQQELDKLMVNPRDILDPKKKARRLELIQEMEKLENK